MTPLTVGLIGIGILFILLLSRMPIGIITQAVSQKAWGMIPFKLQSDIKSVCGLKGSEFWGKNMFDTAEEAAKAAIKDGGYPLIETTLAGSDAERLREMSQPLWEKWVKDMEAAGYEDAQKILDRTLKLIETYKP